MRKRIIVFCLCVLAIACWLLWLYHPTSRRGGASHESGKLIKKQSHQTQSTKQVQIVKGVASSMSNPPIRSNTTSNREATLRRFEEEWKTPIAFYGKVVDQNTNSVAGAHVVFDWNNLSGTQYSHTESDANGLFSISGIQGLELGVKVSKKGYYAYLPFGRYFFYAGKNQTFAPDADNPVVFFLQKKGAAEPLMRLAGAMIGPRQYRLNANGTPTEISFYSGKRTTAGQGQFRVQYWMEPPQGPNQKFTWRCKVSVPGGGLQPTDEEFPFTAPEQGYQESFQMKSDPNAWTYMPEQTFYVHLADGKYGRVKFSLNCSGSPFFGVVALVNPSGSRNLEYDKTLPDNIMVDQSAP